MINTLYSHWSDEVARSATIRVDEGTAEATYDVDRLVDDNPAHLFKANETTVVIQFSYAEKQPIALLGLIHTTLEASDEIFLQGDDDADWYDPAFEIQIPAAGWVGSGVTRWPVNTWSNLTQASGYDPLGFKHYRLTFGVGVVLAQPLQIGQIRLHPSVRSFVLDRGLQEIRSKPRQDNRTAFEVSTIYTRGTTLWRAQFGLSALFDADNERQAIQDLWSDVDGANRPWLIVPDHNLAPCYLVRFATTEEQIQKIVQGVSSRPCVIEEVGRGLRPGV